MRQLIVGLGWLSPFVPIVLWPHTRVYGFVIMALLHALWLYPTLSANVQWFGPVITRFAADTREVWLTIDDGPTEDTPEILQVLQSRGVHATFFLKGSLADRRPQLLREIVAAGHTIGNHTYSHPSATFWCLPAPWIESEIDRCASVIGGVRYFRAPVGMKNPAVHTLLAARGMRLIGWSVRGLDTVIEEPDRIAARIVPGIESGAIILMHQGHAHSARALDRVIDDLQRASYALVIPSDDRLKTNK